MISRSFFNGVPLLSTTHGGIDSLLRGITKDQSLTFDSTFANDMRNFLFAPTGIMYMSQYQCFLISGVTRGGLGASGPR